MALPPTIPTSFVPKQPVRAAASARPTRFTGTGALSALAYFIGAVALVGALFVLGYGYYLDGVRSSEAAELVTAQNGLSQDTVESFVQLRDRLTSANTLLDNHVTLSPFFDDLEKLTLQTVRFNSFKLLVLEDHSGSIQMTGTAKTFNALAAQAESFDTEPLIKSAVFSAITVQKDGTVNFTLSADLDPKLIAGNYTADSEVAPPAETLPGNAATSTGSGTGTGTTTTS